jgi:hypothetical protein
MNYSNTAKFYLYSQRNLGGFVTNFDFTSSSVQGYVFTASNRSGTLAQHAQFAAIYVTGSVSFR